MPFDSAPLPPLSSIDTGKLHTITSDDLQRACTSLASERFRTPVRITVVQRSSFTEAQVVREALQVKASEVPQLKALSTSVRAALESLWRKLRHGDGALT